MREKYNICGSWILGSIKRTFEANQVKFIFLWVSYWNYEEIMKSRKNIKQKSRISKFEGSRGFSSGKIMSSKRFSRSEVFRFIQGRRFERTIDRIFRALKNIKRLDVKIPWSQVVKLRKQSLFQMFNGWCIMFSLF